MSERPYLSADQIKSLKSWLMSIDTKPWWTVNVEAEVLRRLVHEVEDRRAWTPDDAEVEAA